MKLRSYTAAVTVAGLFILGSGAAHAQGTPSGTTSGPAAGGIVQPQTAPDASRIKGPAGSKNGPTGSTASAQQGNAGNAAGVAGPAGSKNGPAQRNGSSTGTK
jgi:hypothetical protein